jgi:short-subunit dehydrogenase
MKTSNGHRATAVTGSSRGIGKPIAREFVQNSYYIVLKPRDEQNLRLKRPLSSS